ncbi:hypothetical protein RvY_11495 [Ramazzottius varieornatus]|uniref:Homeobox domain-containing protein n=1 Tax=Ramazzottius varieornatus TaxID=947166 RepID=A0A1D1VG98_RAMVA|nr:hypothetical protein RvY_11495 [Ramazzottius varieornatus]
MARFRIDDILATAAPEIVFAQSEDNEKSVANLPAPQHILYTASRPTAKRSASSCQQVVTPLITVTSRQPHHETPKQREVAKWEKDTDNFDRKMHQTPDSDDGTDDRSPSNDAQNKKQRKPRTAFSDSQLQSLEKSFERQKYLSVQERMELAAKLQLADAQVKCWFQNRRTKWKRQNSMQYEAADLFPALRQMFPFSNFPLQETHSFHRPHISVFHPVDRPLPFNQFYRPY